RMLLGLQGVWGKVDYNRQAYGISSRSANFEQWTALGKSQKDPFGECSLQCEWTRWILLRVGLGYEVNRSNSYGYAYQRPKAHVLAVKSTASGWTFGFFWTSLVKRYSDSLRPILQIRPESENEENNVILADVAKTLDRGTSVKMQLGLYRNESPFRNLYYQKTLYSLGLTHSF
ncbi:MAG TPA: hypothetical protein VGB38_02380, partial [bacterium]